jgi:parallel beta-helix repeat protein
LVAFVALSAQAFSATVTVGSCTSPVRFATIQQAVNASPAGTVIKICPGNYPEQVAIIAKSLTLEGIESETEDAIVILPPAGGLVANTTDVDSGDPVAAQLVVRNTGSVSISNLTVDGTGNGLSCGPDVRGILFQSSSGTVKHVAVRNQVPNGIPNGCQVGESIWVETAADHSSIVTIEHSSVHNYNKNGITGNDASTNLTLTGNYVQGAGVVPGSAAQNGIQVGFGATGTIKDNIVIDNIYGDPTVAASADVLLYDAAENSSITISRNIVGNSQLPIALYTDTVGVGDGVSVTGNRAFGASTYDGIDVCTDGNTVTGNTIVNSAESGVHLDASCGSTGQNNTVTGNVILESACAGILDDTNGAGGNTITDDTYFTVPFTLTSSTSKCTVAAGPAMLAKAKAMPKVSPAR